MSYERMANFCWGFKQCTWKRENDCSFEKLILVSDKPLP